MARKNLFQKVEDLRDNIETFGLGSGVAYTILDHMEEEVDNLGENVNQACDRLLEISNNPKQLLVPVLNCDLMFDKPCSKKKLEAGDVIAVTRMNGIYQHFAVYIGNDRVIHFAAENGDWGGTPIIHEAPFENFLRDSDEFEILDFSETRKTPRRYNGIMPSTGTAMIYNTIPQYLCDELLRNIQYHLYSPEETVERAKGVAEQCAKEGSRIETWLNGHKYSLVFNNCEHFAIWCKTGVHESRQVDRILKLFVTPTPNIL